MSTKSQRKTEAAAEAKRRAQELQAQQRRRDGVKVAAILVAALAFAALVTWVVFVIVSQDSAPDTEGDFAVYDAGSLTVPSVVDDNDAIVVGAGGVAGVDIPADGVRVDIYEDFHCSACAAFSFYTHDQVAALAASGEVAVAYYPLAFFDGNSDGSAYSTRAAAAAVTVAEYDPASFVAFWSIMFANQPEYHTPGPTNAEIADMARAAGVSEDAIARIADGEFTQWVAAATERASIAGVRSTPTVLIDGAVYEGNWTIDGQLMADVLSAAAARDAA